MDIDLALRTGIDHKIQQKSNEWKWLLTKCEQHNVKSILEIGCYSGGGTFSFATFADRIITIDCINPMFDISKIGCQYNYIVGHSASESTIEKVAALLGSEKVDLLFIDGDHSYDGAKSDFELYGKFVSKLIAFHDIVDSDYHRGAGCYVSRFWSEIKTAYCSDEIIEARDWAGIGVLEIR